MNVQLGAASVLSETIGTAAAILTTSAFTPQAIRTWRVGGEGLSWMMLAFFGTGVGLWFIYGLMLSSAPIILANGITGAQVLFILAVKIWRRGSAQDAAASSRGSANAAAAFRCARLLRRSRNHPRTHSKAAE